MLPMIDEIRRKIGEACNYTEPIELGSLKFHLEKKDERDNDRNQWYDMVKKATEIRNNLAHYTPVEYDDFKRLWDISSELHKRRYKRI